jgi:hypothetical protein
LTHAADIFICQKIGVDMKQKQHDEFHQVIGEILEEEKNFVEAKCELLEPFWVQGSES